MQKIDIRKLLKDPSLFKEEAFINGGWVKTANTFAVTNPATGEEIAQVSNLESKDAELAIQAAQSAFQ